MNLSSASAEQLVARHCLPCEGGVTPYTLEQAAAQVADCPVGA